MRVRENETAPGLTTWCHCLNAVMYQEADVEDGRQWRLGGGGKGQIAPPHCAEKVIYVRN